MNSYGLSALIAIMAAAGTLAVVPTFASTFYELACPACGSNDIYASAQLATQTKLPISVWTDQKTYDHESIIVVSGAVANLRGDAPVTVTVFGPQNNLVTVRQVEVSEDNTFETSFSTAGALFKQNGVYTIRVQYGPQEINDKVTVELVGEVPMEEGVCGMDELVIKAGGDTYCVPYEVSGAVVEKATVDGDTASMTLMIDAKSDGFITLTIPRSVLESQSGGQDTDFIVLVDGEEANFEETDSNIDARTIDVAFSEGATQIEIIGTWAIPEFGTMAAIILAVAIVSIIVVSARSRLSILPRY